MTNLRYFGADDLERLEETDERIWKQELRDQFVTALVVLAYGAFLAGLLWMMSIRPATPL